MDARLRRLNELGFDVAEIKLRSSVEGVRIELNPHAVEPGHHTRRLKLLTELAAQENQARRLLNDIDDAAMDGKDGSVHPRKPIALVAHDSMGKSTVWCFSGTLSKRSLMILMSGPF